MATTTLTQTSSTSTLQQSYERYALRNDKSKQLHESAHDYFPGGNTRTILYSAPFPLTFASGQDGTLTSIDRHTYVDLLNEYSAGVFGHSNARIRNAIEQALAKGWNFGGQSTYEKTLAAKVVDRFKPGGIELVRFTNSGTESNMMALAAAIAFTGRKKVLVFSSGYHGGTLIFPMEVMKNSDILTANLPHDFVYAPFNNVEETQAILDRLPPDSLAAVLVEPLQGSGGCRPATPRFLHFLRSTCYERGAIFIVDEVMSSRLGPHGYLATHGLKADLMSLGKYIGGGMTFGAFGGRRDIMQLFDPAHPKLQHPGTYNNNIVTMAAGIEGLDIFNAAEVERINALGTRFRKQIQEILVKEGLYDADVCNSDYSVVEVDSFVGPTQLETPDNAALKPVPKIFVAGYGSMLNIRFSGPQTPLWQSIFYHHMLDNNIYVAARGYMTISLEVKSESIDLFIAALKSFLAIHKSEVCG